MQSTSTKKAIVDSLRKTNWKAILFFTSFTFLLWLILQFTKTHTVNYPIRIQFKDIPVKQVLQVNEINLSATIKQTGFKLFKKKFTSATVQIAITELPQRDAEYIFKSNLYLSEIALQLNIPEDDLLIKNEEINLPFSIKSTKKIPIIFNVELSYAKSYASFKGIQFEMDSVQIAGSVDELSSISNIKTEVLQLQNIKEDISGELPLVTSFSENTALETPRVGYRIEVEKFSEQQFTIPIQLINAPDDFIVDLLPHEVTVKFQSSLRQLDDIEAADFEVVCDYSEALNKANILIPKLIKKPKSTIRIKIEPNRLEYILRK